MHSGTGGSIASGVGPGISNLDVIAEGNAPGRAEARIKVATNLVSTPVLCEERTQAIRRNCDLPAVQGMLVKYATRGPLGLLGEVMHSRWFKLNPANATLSYWVPGCCYGPPRRAYKLQELEQVDTNEYHNRIFLKFVGRPLLRLKATCSDEFERWMEMITSYVQKPAAVAADAASVHLDFGHQPTLIFHRAKPIERVDLEELERSTYQNQHHETKDDISNPPAPAPAKIPEKKIAHGKHGEDERGPRFAAYQRRDDQNKSVVAKVKSFVGYAKRGGG
jgi:hypothetical protein